jgi:lysophospholipase L1-like esterase
LGATFSDVSRATPILRIALAVGVLAVSASCNKFGDQNAAAPSGPPVPGSAIVYTAIGASDAAGVGSSVVCVPFTDCPDGMGYVPVTVRTLKARGYSVTLLNLGIPTAVVGRDVEALGAQYGRFIAGNFIDSEAPFVQTASTITTVFGGVNDVITVVSAMGQGAAGGNPQAYIDAQVRGFASTFSSLISAIRSRAAGTRIIVLNVPNVAALPYFAGGPLDQRQTQQRLSVGFTTQAINVLTSQGITVVDLMCDARSYVPSNYSSDFHPNDAGYAFISGEVVNAITSPSYPAPSGSCPQMSVVP